MGITNNAMEVPEVTWRYWGIYETMMNNPGLYTMDRIRTECHDELCKWYGLTKEQTKAITDNMDKLEHAVELHDKLLEIARA
jgi:hypothetical protein